MQNLNMVCINEQVECSISFMRLGKSILQNQCKNRGNKSWARGSLRGSRRFSMMLPLKRITHDRIGEEEWEVNRPSKIGMLMFEE